MIPSSRLLAALASLALLGVLSSAAWLPAWSWWLALSLLVSLALVDAWRVSRVALPRIERTVPRVLPLGREHEVELSISNESDNSLCAGIFDHFPGDWVATGMPASSAIGPRRKVRLRYRVRPTRRGAATFPCCVLRLTSPLGLWLRQVSLPVQTDVRVFPNFSPLAQLALVSAERAGRVAGAHVQRRRGDGSDFRQLRDFRIGDSLRQVDWKASMRMRRPISREYQEDRNQQVIVLLDQGRRMLAHDGDLSHFDHVLNASLVLAYIALRQGDAFGVIPALEPAGWLAPRRGGGAINAVMDSVYSLEARPETTDYLAVANALAARQQRRALVFLVTNLRDEDHEELIAAARQLSRRHLVQVISLREQVLDQVADHLPKNPAEAVLYGGVVEYLEKRRRSHQLLRGLGVKLMDVTCAELPAALAESYLAVKRSGSL